MVAPFKGRASRHWRFPVSVTSKAIDSIRGMIRSGELAPGERLPPEQELADRLGVSRGSLREAVRALSQINVLDVRRGDGTYVTSLDPSELLSGMAFAMELIQAKDLDEVVEVRQLLLPPAAALAAQRVTKAQLARMRAVLEQLEQATDPDEIARLHEVFGSLVYDATGNETLGSILRALQVRGENVRRAWLAADPARRDIALTHQRMLFDALERGDSAMAESISVVQVERRRRWIERLRTVTPVEGSVMD
jgi:GntR family transcriptional regulator, transcriptional repressor for pyruvate dehydrogenase complex